eukprot:scaffold20382_cov129-Isochrysis_galbana.AAC.3
MEPHWPLITPMPKGLGTGAPGHAGAGASHGGVGSVGRLVSVGRRVRGSTDRSIRPSTGECDG